jgi:hypothetical protein
MFWPLVYSFLLFCGNHFWFLLKLGSQIENEAVQFWGVE